VQPLETLEDCEGCFRHSFDGSVLIIPAILAETAVLDFRKALVEDFLKHDKHFASIRCYCQTQSQLEQDTPSF